MDIVNDVLSKHQKELEKYKPITVKKHLECTVDIGHMMVVDPNYFDDDAFKTNTEQYILDLTRDNVQLLINEIWELPTERVEEQVVAKLPAPKLPLPRSRKLPEPKALTKWEQFAKEKGIKKRVKDKKVYDDVLDKWVPTYGYQRAKAEKEKDWMLEVPQNVDPMKDMFQAKKDLRTEKVARNEINRMKNIARVKKIPVPRAGFIGPESASSKDLLTAVTVAKASTASVGKFQDKLPKEKVARGLGVRELIPGVKRKRSHQSIKGEKSSNLEMITKILNKKPKIDMDKAISLQKREARNERMAAEADEDPQSKGKKRGAGKSKKKGYNGAAGNKKPRGGKGERNPGKRKSFGRKRR